MTLKEKVTVIFKEKYDITNIILGKITFKDAIDNIAYDVEFDIFYTERLYEIGYKTFDSIKIITNETKEVIFEGILYEYDYEKSYKSTGKWQLYEKNKILDDSDDEFLALKDTTATQRAKDICRRWNIPCNLIDTQIKLAEGDPKVTSLFSAIQDDLKETVEKGGKMYKICFPDNKLEFFEIGNNNDVIDITKLGKKEKGSRSMKDVVTRVKVIAKENEGSSSGGGSERVKNKLSQVVSTFDKDTERFGVRQKIIERQETEDAKSAKEMADAKLQGETHETTYEMVDIPSIRAGHKVKLYSRYYIVSSLTREISDRTILNLTLLTEEMVKRKYYANRQ